MLNIRLHVIIRPRGGDFLYSDNDLVIMPGAGLDENNIRDFAGQVRASEYHATLRHQVDIVRYKHVDDLYDIAYHYTKDQIS